MRLLVLACLLTAACAASADSIDDLANAAIKNERVPGMTISILRDGKPVKQAAYGLADVENRAPARIDSVYELASVSKQFTAVLVLQLAEEGQLSLDDPVSKYVPEAPRTWEPMRVRHLLTHTSGLPEFHFLPNRMNALSFMRYTVDMQVQDIRRSRLSFTPGTKFGYSNAGYELLAIIAQQVAGKPFEELRRERILDPLGMTKTVTRSASKVIPNRADGYTLRNGELTNWTLSHTLQAVDADGFGGLMSTVGDLAKWEGALAAGKLLKPETWKIAWSPTTLSDGTISRYGMGWAVEDTPFGQAIAHSGHTGTYLVRLPDKRLTVIVLSNLGIGTPPPYGQDKGWNLGAFTRKLTELAAERYAK
jgi:CubicO group peptidase (beta-lactamase class C family)